MKINSTTIIAVLRLYYNNCINSGLKEPCFYFYLITHSISNIEFHVAHRASISDIEFHLRHRIPSWTSISILDIDFHLEDRILSQKLSFNLSKIEFNLKDQIQSCEIESQVRRSNSIYEIECLIK